MMEQQNIVVPDTESTYSMRRLNASDMFLMSSIIGKIGLKELGSCLSEPDIIAAAKGIFSKSNGTADNSQTVALGISVAMNMAEKILIHLPECQNEVFTLLAQVSGLSQKEIATMDAAAFLYMLIDFIKKEEFQDFIKAASRLMK